MAKDDRSGEFTGVLGFFIALCTLLVLLRCYCKVIIVKSFAADDWFSLITLVWLTRPRASLAHRLIVIDLLPGLLLVCVAGLAEWHGQEGIPDSSREISRGHEGV
jgi:O-antigen ligase